MLAPLLRRIGLGLGLRLPAPLLLPLPVPAVVGFRGLLLRPLDLPLLGARGAGLAARLGVLEPPLGVMRGVWPEGPD